MTPLPEHQQQQQQQQQQNVPSNATVVHRDHSNEKKTKNDKPLKAPSQLFPTKYGYTTAQTRLDYIDALGFLNDDNNEDDEVPTGLQAKSIHAKNNKVYPWQLYSLLGSDRIEDLIHHFYTRVFDDKQNAHFRKAFTKIADLNHHVHAQTCFWIDAMGGGRVYHGGDGRLKFHHHRNAGPNIMNAAGATRWMHHMRLALLQDVQAEWNALDDRIVPCVCLFLKIKMQKYARQHEWVFDERDFPK